MSAFSLAPRRAGVAPIPTLPDIYDVSRSRDAIASLHGHTLGFCVFFRYPYCSPVFPPVSELSSATHQDERIYGGESVATCAWPTTVGIQGCTATLVHPELLITAAPLHHVERPVELHRPLR